MKEDNENNDDIIIPREITKKSSQETDAFGRSDMPELDNNLQSISNKAGPEHDSKFGSNKKMETSNESNNNKKSIRRIDSFGNLISKKGKQKISFKEKNNLVDVIKIESFKDYNKMEEISNQNNMQNNCCIIE